MGWCCHVSNHRWGCWSVFSCRVICFCTINASFDTLKTWNLQARNKKKTPFFHCLKLDQTQLLLFGQLELLQLRFIYSCFLNLKFTYTSLAFGDIDLWTVCLEPHSCWNPDSFLLTELEEWVRFLPDLCRRESLQTWDQIFVVATPKHWLSYPWATMWPLWLCP